MGQIVLQQILMKHVTFFNQDRSSRFDQVTALLFNVPSGTMPFISDAMPFDFSNATISEINPCVNVSDSFSGALGTACRSFTEFSYTRTFGPYASCVSGTEQFSNTAIFTTSDTHTIGSANWTITVTVPCSGRTLTIGCWKIHAGLGPQPDVMTHLLPINLGTLGGSLAVTVLTAVQAVSILYFGGSNGAIDASNGINRLDAQLLAAKLNIKNGADGSAVASAISEADAFLAIRNSMSWVTLSRTLRYQVNSWFAILDNYNNGIIGPGHCTEQNITSSSAALNTVATTDITSIVDVTESTLEAVESVTERNDGTVTLNPNSAPEICDPGYKLEPHPYRSQCFIVKRCSCNEWNRMNSSEE